jgi:radical SAM superfamily enzyme YgiQ (UPF0313 family)
MDKQLAFGVRRGRTIPMLATRGCPYRCTFCSSPQMWTTQWLTRSPQSVIEEMEKYIRLYRTENFDFYDLTAIIRKEWITEFCRQLIRKNWNITWQLPTGTRSEAIDEETCGLLYRSGCRNITYAPESGSPDMLRRIKKRVDLDRMLTSARAAVRSGLNVKFNIVLGFPGETHRHVWETFGFLARAAWAGVHDALIALFTPYPGSELFEELHAAGRIRMDDAYFESLAVSLDISRSSSWSEGISARMLRFYRLFGVVLFYAVSYLRYPQRLFLVASHLVTGQHESRLETSLALQWSRLGAQLTRRR